MEKEKDYIRDIAEIRSMMERTSKFLSLSGWAGVMAGIYALAGAFLAYRLLSSGTSATAETTPAAPYAGGLSPVLPELIFLALAILVLAIGTAVFFSYNKAAKRGERIWNATSRRLLINMSVP